MLACARRPGTGLRGLIGDDVVVGGWVGIGKKEMKKKKVERGESSVRLLPVVCSNKGRTVVGGG